MFTWSYGLMVFHYLWFLSGIHKCIEGHLKKHISWNLKVYEKVNRNKKSRSDLCFLNLAPCAPPSLVLPFRSIGAVNSSRGRQNQILTKKAYAPFRRRRSSSDAQQVVAKIDNFHTYLRGKEKRGELWSW